MDVSGLTFIDSAALHEIVWAHRELRAERRLLALVGPSREVARILGLSAPDQVLSCTPLPKRRAHHDSTHRPQSLPASMAEQQQRHSLRRLSVEGRRRSINPHANRAGLI